MKQIQLSKSMVQAMCIYAIGLLVMSFVIVARAEGVPADTVTNEDFILLLFKSIGGLKGATTLMIAYTVAEVLIQFLKTPLFGSIFKKVNAAMKLTIAMGLHFVSSTLALIVVDGLSIEAALVSGSTISAFAILLNQIYQTYIKDKK
jgi:hypothetical protein